VKIQNQNRWNGTILALRIPIINQNENIIKMLEVVKKTQNGGNRNLYEVPVIEFNNNTNLKAFLYKMV